MQHRLLISRHHSTIYAEYLVHNERTNERSRRCIRTNRRSEHTTEGRPQNWKGNTLKKIVLRNGIYDNFSYFQPVPIFTKIESSTMENFKKLFAGRQKSVSPAKEIPKSKPQGFQADSQAMSKNADCLKKLEAAIAQQVHLTD